MRFCIVGTGRCGTALLRRLLRLNSEVCIYRETHWWPIVYQTCRASRTDPRAMLDIVNHTYWVGGRRELDVTLDDIGLPRQTFERRISAVLRNCGPLTIAQFGNMLAEAIFGERGGISWADKSPDYGPYLSMLQSIWPQCRFIHILRHGFPTAVSMSRHRGFQLMESLGMDTWVPLSQSKSHPSLPEPARDWTAYLSTWRRRIRRIREESTRVAPGSYLEVKYEELLRDPAGVLRGIATFVDLSPEPRWLTQAAAIIDTGRAEFRLPSDFPDRAGAANGLFRNLSG